MGNKIKACIILHFFFFVPHNMLQSCSIANTSQKQLDQNVQHILACKSEVTTVSHELSHNNQKTELCDGTISAALWAGIEFWQKNLLRWENILQKDCELVVQSPSWHSVTSWTLVKMWASKVHLSFLPQMIYMEKGNAMLVNPKGFILDCAEK